MAAGCFTCDVDSEFPNQRGCFHGVVLREWIKTGVLPSFSPDSDSSVFSTHQVYPDSTREEMKRLLL